MKSEAKGMALSSKNVLFISHKEKQCGVHQFGLNIANALKKSLKYTFVYAECSDADELQYLVKRYQPVAIIYNYHPSTLPWLRRKTIRKINALHIDIIHEVTQEVADAADDWFFDYHIAPDPGLLLKNPLVFKTGRLVLTVNNKYPLPDIPTIGSFGFATEGKGFERLVETVQQEFDHAIIRLNIPFATFADADGSIAKATAERCNQLVIKPGIQLVINHQFLTQNEVLDFLAQNTLNVFLYAANIGRGISSVTDYALAVQRPMAISRSTMFRHLHSAIPSICIESSSLKQIIKNGLDPISGFCREWNEANVIWDYERIIDNVLGVGRKPRIVRYAQKLSRVFAKVEVKKNRDSWMPTLDHASIEQQTYQGGVFCPVDVPDVNSFNRILDNTARAQYKSCIDAMFDLLPRMMAEKIPEANVQQAFVLDTVNKFARGYKSPKILCVGSYGDTAFECLKKCGYWIEEVDPLLNYDLNTFLHKPSTVNGTYDIVFSTSVIEHVRDDELFLTQLASLLAPDGIAVLTCDYNDQYQPGDAIPVEDFHMYTKRDLTVRLMPLLKDCSLVDKPQWDCPDPDFVYAGYHYTFATLVFRKKAA